MLHMIVHVVHQSMSIGACRVLTCCASVSRFVKLPWEENPDFFTDNLPPAGRNFVADLLQRAPEARKPIRTALLSPLFGDVAPGAPGPNTELHTPANIMSTASEWI